jgi:hypothetical protein
MNDQGRLKKNLQLCWELEQASAEDRHKNEAGSQNNFCSYLVPFFRRRIEDRQPAQIQSCLQIPTYGYSLDLVVYSIDL